MHARTHTHAHAHAHARADPCTCMHVQSLMRTLMHNALKVHGIVEVTYTGNVGFLDVCLFFVATPPPTENNNGGHLPCISNLRCNKILSGLTLLRTSQGNPEKSLINHLAISRKLLLRLGPRKMGKLF